MSSSPSSPLSPSSESADPRQLLARLRSLLFVPGDRPERMEKALSLGADALILDLEDAVAPAAKPAARAAVVARLAASRDHGVLLVVRVNALDSPYLGDDLAAVLPAAPDALLLPKTDGAATVAALGERAPFLPPILALAAETADGLLDLPSLRHCAGRLCGLTWGAEDLATELGAANRTPAEAGGDFTSPFQLARSTALFTAAACRVPAFETVYADFRDEAGLARQAETAARDGFSGMLAIHPAQLAAIHRAFTPGAEAIARASAIVDAFAAQPEAGVLRVDGRMVDAPHLKRARALLARSRR